MRFCSACGGPVALVVPPGDERPRAVCQRCGTVHYENPKVVVGAVCTLDERVLLCRRAIEPRLGFWTVPAGYLELGETAEAGALREAWEEARARIELTGLLAVYSVIHAHQVQLLYRATLVDSNVEAGPESLEVALLPWAQVPWADLAFPTVTWILQRAMAVQALGTAPLVTGSNPDGADGTMVPDG